MSLIFEKELSAKSKWGNEHARRHDRKTIKQRENPLDLYKCISLKYYHIFIVSRVQNSTETLIIVISAWMLNK